MSTGFVQVAPDSTGKQLDNDVVQIPAGTVLTDGSGNQTTLAAPAYYFRERVVSADPNNPVAVSRVQNADGPNPQDFGLTVRLPAGQADLQAIIGQLQNLNQLLQVLGLAAGQQQVANQLYPVAGMPPGILSPGTPRQAISDIFGRQITVPHSSREAQGNATLLAINSGSAQTLVAAAGAGQFVDLVAIVANNTSATATSLNISDGTQTIPLYLPAGDVRGLSLGGVIIKATNPNTAWTATCGAAVVNVNIWCSYVQNRQI